MKDGLGRIYLDWWCETRPALQDVVVPGAGEGLCAAKYPTIDGCLLMC